MIVLLALLFRLCCAPAARGGPRQADKGIAGSMEGHAAMDMSVQRRRSFSRRLLSPDGFTSVSHVFVMEWAAILRDLVIGLLVAGAIAAWVPDSFWQAFFLAGHPLAAKLWGPLVGPLVAVLLRLLDRQRAAGRGAVDRRDQLRRRGRVPLRRPDHPADPEHLPQVLRRRMARFLFGTFYVAMALAGYLVEWSSAAWADPRTAQRAPRPGRVLELHDLAQPGVPAWPRSWSPVRAHRRPARCCA